jgi:hypothetical protein
MVALVEMVASELSDWELVPSRTAGAKVNGEDDSAIDMAGSVGMMAATPLGSAVFSAAGVVKSVLVWAELEWAGAADDAIEFLCGALFFCVFLITIKQIAMIKRPTTML